MSRRHRQERSYELDSLQRKFREMEATRKLKHKFTDNPENTIRMQRQQIQKLKRDNDRLKEDLALETRQAKQANNMSASAQIAKLQDQADMYTRKVEQEKRKIEELDENMAKMEALILAQKQKMGGINATRKNNQQVQKSIRILENKLDKALVKFNEALAHNKQLREQIDNLRRERVVFDGIYKRLERELHEKKIKMAHIIEIANVAAQARDDAQASMVALKEQADKEQQNFEVEWSQLGRRIEKDRQMKDFVKERDRSAGADPALEEEQKLKRRVTKGAWGIAKDKASIHMSMEKVQAYEEAFAKIQKATGISDIDELVETFIKAEDQNFSLFNYVNDLSNESEKLEESIATLNEEIEKYQGDGQEQGNPMTRDNQRKTMLRDLEEKLEKTESKADVYSSKYQQSMRTVNALKTGIQEIFVQIGCEDNGILGNAGVTESNMMQYLGIIEQRTNELLATYAEQITHDLPPDEADDESPVSGEQLTIEAPSLANDLDGEATDEEEDAMPFFGENA